MRPVDVALERGAETWLYPTSLTLAPGTINVLLGATRAGKTTLLRLMAGLEHPSGGQILAGERDVTRVPVRERDVAMVYQQFINYPSLTVFENIASPLRAARVPAARLRERVGELAAMLRLTDFLARRPDELSGGQQQRVALARALAKDAGLLLLDEPLVNLDYKLREQLRLELRGIFAQRGTTVVYATTEAHEALQLGGHTHLLAQGRLLQSGPTLELFRRPRSLEAARAFSDPPLNVLPVTLGGDRRTAILADGSALPLPPALVARIPQGATSHTFAIRPHRLTRAARAQNACALSGQVDLAEISGSDTYVHLSSGRVALIAQLPGVHGFTLGERCTLYADPADFYCFDGSGELLFAPEH